MLRFFVAVLGLTLGLANSLWSADTENEQLAVEQAARDVTSALQAEVDGDFLTRQLLLNQASQSELPASHWHRGEIQNAQGQWERIDDNVQKYSKTDLLEKYESLRSRTADAVGPQISLAQWCAKNGLVPQAIAHLHRVLNFDPDNSVARRALGYQEIANGEWISPREILAIAQRTEATQKSIEKYGKQFSEIIKRFSSTRPELRSKAEQELMSIDEPDAVAAAEAFFADAPDPISLKAIEWFSSIDDVEPSQVLTRYALFHGSEKVRAAAEKALSNRPLHDFVPDVLNMLTSPVSSAVVPAFDRSGRLTGYRQAFAQETFSRNQFVVVDNLVNRETVRTNNLILQNQINNRLIAVQLEQLANEQLNVEATTEAQVRTATMTAGNLQIVQRNHRIAKFLGNVANEEFDGEPRQMWRWWDDYNQTRYQDYKPERYQRTALVRTTVQYAPPVSCECFAAGTLVTTSRGEKPIDRIVVGDLVLSKDTQTGELSWKPVIRTTIRPPEETVVMSTGEETFRCTGGHLFWVSGKGWMAANKLKSGEILHGAEEPLVVTSVKPSAKVNTFNLEVLDNATYFVGKGKVLTHDVTPRAGDHQTVPGLQFASR